MDVAEYQAKTLLTEIYGDSIHVFTREGTVLNMWEALRIQYVALGLAGEAGEIANKVKKQIRDNPTDSFNSQFKGKMVGEIGDLMWYVSQLCNELGLDLEQIMIQNIRKLTDRQDRGTLSGSGDDR